MQDKKIIGVFHPIKKGFLPPEAEQYDNFIVSEEVVVMDAKHGLQKAWTKRWTSDFYIVGELVHRKGDFQWEASRGSIISEVTHWLEVREMPGVMSGEIRIIPKPTYDNND